MRSSYGILIGKLDEFIRKYYRNQILKGLILFLALLLFSFLLITFSEYLGHFGPVVRTILFYLFILANLMILGFYIVIPVLKFIQIGKRISREQAAEIIGKHFTEVKDRLLNVLQLHNLYLERTENIDLIRAGIDQKIVQLKPVPFTRAIDISKNRRYLKYAIPPLAIILLLFIAAPSVLTTPSERLIHHNLEFVKEMPFRITILNKKLEVFQQEDFTLKVKVEGETLPDEMFVEENGINYKFTKEDKLRFSYTFKTLQKSVKFRIIAGGFPTGDYEIKVYPKPTILNFDVDLKYPQYLNRKEELLENTGDLIIPEGTLITWRFYTKDVDKLSMSFGDEIKSLPKNNRNIFEFKGSFSKNTKYSLYILNSFVKEPDSLGYSITVIPDGFPSITAASSNDSLLPTRLYFQGLIKDDYGFSRLTFNYQVYPEGDTTKRVKKTESMVFDKSVNQQQFYYSVDISKITSGPGDELEYYFEVCDNDMLHGGKCARTETMKFKTPTAEDIDKMISKKEQDITKNLENALSDSKKLQKQIDEMAKKLTEKSTLNWQDKKQLEDLLEKEKNIKETVEQIQQQNQQKNNFEEQYKSVDPNIQEKQKQLNQLFNEVMTDEMKKMVEEIRNMLDKIDKNQVGKMLEQMKFNNKDLESQLDRNLELFKKLEFDKKLTETIEKLNKSAEEQEKLSEKTEEKRENNENLKKEQDQINQNFQDIKKDLDELGEKNAKLEEPYNFPNTEQKEQDIDNNLNQSKDALEKNQRKEAKKNQKSASGKMKSLAQQLSAMQSDMDSEKDAEDFETLREILENLVRISFDQEELMSRTKSVSRNDPKFLGIIQEQNDLKEDLKLVEDSLREVAKRQVMIKPYIMRELATINRNVDESVKNLNDRNMSVAASKQQFTMTSVNNLALMLAESLKSMESQSNMQCKNPGKSSCNKGSGKGKMSMKSMRQMQEKLNRDMESLKKGLESQKKGQKGQMNGMSGKQMNEQLARMAAEQEAIRNEMRKYQEQLNEEGIKDGGNLSEAIKQMEETEKDIVNKRILQETLKRQQDILTRLLESEKAELQREQEEKRQSTEAKNQKFSNPPAIFKYNGKKGSSTEMLKTVQPSYNYFYKNKINNYFLKL